MFYDKEKNIIYFKVNFLGKDNHMSIRDEDDDWGDEEEINDWDSFEEELDDDEWDEEDLEDDEDDNDDLEDEEDEEEDVDDDLEDDVDPSSIDYYEYRDDSEDDE
jgi:hypothetical protein